NLLDRGLNMKITRIVSTGSALLLACLLQSASQGQINQGVATPAYQYFGSRSSNPLPAGQQMQVGGRAIIHVHQQLQVSGGKPFQDIQQQPTLSPYLALDAVPERNTSLPNWHLFVQPQMQQRRAGEAKA